jgi:hypothetical protein
MKLNYETLNRRRLLNIVIVLVFLAVPYILQFNVQVNAAQGGFSGGVFDIVPDSPVLSSLPSQGTPVFLTGKVYPFRTVNQATCTPVPASVASIGIWRAWGQVAENGRLVLNQSLELDALNGVLEIQGPTGLISAFGDPTPAVPGTTGEPFTGPSEVVAVTGGVGTYRGANGEAQIRPYCQSQADTLQPFRYDRPFCVSLQETPRRRN